LQKLKLFVKVVTGTFSTKKNFVLSQLAEQLWAVPEAKHCSG